MSDLANRVALVTGAGGGMGLQIASDLIHAGARVLMLDLKPKPESIPGTPDQSHYQQVDLTDAARVADAVDTAVQLFGGIDLLANVAGALWFERDKSALEIDLDDWDQVMAINLKSMVHTLDRWCPVCVSGAEAPWYIFLPRSVCGVILHHRMPTRRPRPASSLFPNHWRSS